MSSRKKVVIALDPSMEPAQLNLFSGVDNFINCDLELVHLIQEIDYGDGTSFNVAFPNDEDKSQLTLAVIESMKQLSQEFLPPGHLGQIRYRCLFAEDIKDAFCQYLFEEKASLAIVTSFHLHNLFDVSLGDYLSHRAPCGVLVMKGKSPKLKNVTVGVKLDEIGNIAGELAGFEFLKTANITLLHISHVSEFSYFSGLDITPYSIEEEKIVVEREVLKRLENLKASLVRKGFTGEISTVCEFSNHPKKHFLFYLKNNQIGCAFLFRRHTRMIRGSFVQYVLHHSDVSTLVSAPNESAQETQLFHPSFLRRHKGNSGVRKHP